MQMQDMQIELLQDALQKCLIFNAICNALHPKYTWLQYRATYDLLMVGLGIGAARRHPLRMVTHSRQGRYSEPNR